VAKGEVEGKTLLDAMRDGATEGMQTFDGEIEKLIRDDVVDLETGLSYATNPGNLRLELADLADPGKKTVVHEPKSETELEIEP